MKFCMEEYTSLRDEVIRRTEMRNNIITLAIGVAGALLGFSFTNPEIALIYPPLAFFICMMWAQNDIRALQISDYLQQLETKDSLLGWVTYYKKVQGRGSFIKGLPFSVIAPGGVFIITSLIALGIGWSVWLTKTLYTILMITDAVFIIAMFIIVLVTKNQRISRRIANAKKTICK